MFMKNKISAGFTLVELLVVMALITILSTIMAPNIVRMREIYVVKGEMQKVISFISLAKGAALKYNDQITMIFPANTKGAQVEMFVDTNRNLIKDAGETVLQDRLRLDPNLKITDTAPVKIGIPPSGLLTGLGDIVIHFQYNDKPVYRRVIISATGRIRVERQ